MTRTFTIFRCEIFVEFRRSYTANMLAGRKMLANMFADSDDYRRGEQFRKLTDVANFISPNSPNVANNFAILQTANFLACLQNRRREIVRTLLEKIRMYSRTITHVSRTISTYCRRRTFWYAYITDAAKLFACFANNFTWFANNFTCYENTFGWFANNFACFTK